MKRLPPVLPGRAYDLAATTVVSADLESGSALGAAACGVGVGGSNPELLPRREEEFNDLLDLDFILSNSLSHQESVAATVSSSASASASSSSSPSSSGPASAPPTCSFSYPIRAGGDPSVVAPGSTTGPGGGGSGGAGGGGGGGLLYSRESAPPPAPSFNLADINDVSPSGGFVAELLRPELDPVYIPPQQQPPPGGGLMGKFVLKSSLSAPGGEYGSQSVISVGKGSPDGSHPVVVTPYSGGPPRMCPKIKQEAVSSCTVSRSLEAHLGAGPSLSNGHRPSAHDFSLGRQLPSRTTPTLGAEELLSARDCHPALSLPPGFHPHPGPNYSAFLTDQIQNQVTALHYQGQCLPVGENSFLTLDWGALLLLLLLLGWGPHMMMLTPPCSNPQSSCHPVPAWQKSPSQRGGEGRGPGKGLPLTLVIMRAAAKPTRRALISKHTCEPTQVGRRAETPKPEWQARGMVHGVAGPHWLALGRSWSLPEVVGCSLSAPSLGSQGREQPTGAGLLAQEPFFFFCL